MKPLLPLLGDARDALLVIGIAAAMTGSSAIAAGLTTTVADRNPAGAVAPSLVGGTPSPVEQRPELTTCDCDAARQPVRPGPAPTERRPIVHPEPPRLHAPEQSRSMEPASFDEWMRAETDPRHMLSRMTKLARHAPRAIATEPKA